VGGVDGMKMGDAWPMWTDDEGEPIWAGWHSPPNFDQNQLEFAQIGVDQLIHPWRWWVT